MRSVLMTAGTMLETHVAKSKNRSAEAEGVGHRWHVAVSNLALAQRTEYTFKAQSELVLVDVSVRDRNGHLVRDLKPEDFTILEDNKPQKVSSFDIENMGPRQPWPPSRSTC